MWCTVPDVSYRLTLGFPALPSFLERVTTLPWRGATTRPVLNRTPHLGSLALHPQGWGLFFPVRFKGPRVVDRVLLAPLLRRKAPHRVRLPIPLRHDGDTQPPRAIPLPAPDRDSARWLLLGVTPGRPPAWCGILLEGRCARRKSIQVDARPVFCLTHLEADLLFPLRLGRDHLTVLAFRTAPEGLGFQWGVVLWRERGTAEEARFVSLRQGVVSVPDARSRTRCSRPLWVGFQWPHLTTGLVSVLVSHGTDGGVYEMVVPVVQGRVAHRGFLVPQAIFSFPLRGQDEAYLYWGQFVYHIPTGRGGQVVFRSVQGDDGEPRVWRGLGGYHDGRLHFIGGTAAGGVWMTLPTWEEMGWARPLSDVWPLWWWARSLPAVRWSPDHSVQPLLFALSYTEGGESHVHLTSMAAVLREMGVPDASPASQQGFWQVSLEEIPAVSLRVSSWRSTHVGCPRGIL